MGALPGHASLVDEAREYLRAKYAKPGNVYLGVVSRLDSMVTGAIVLARTSKAAARLTEQFRQRTVSKVYLAVVAGVINPPAAELVDWLWKNENEHRMQIAPARQSGAAEARLRYERLLTREGRSLLRIELETGRKHQIRLQLSSRGHPIVGDTKYGGRERFSPGIALHAWRLAFAHPTTREQLQFTVSPPASWRTLGIELGDLPGE